MSSPSTAIREIIIAALNTEFTPEGIVFVSDRMHAAMGIDGPVAAVYPDTEYSRVGREIEQQTSVYVQMYAQWDKQIDPTQQVDPTLVEGWADRLRIALRSVQDPHTGTIWFFYVTQIDYMSDPTGNVSRFLARVQGHSANDNLVETGP